MSEISSALVNALRSHPELALFLTIALGYTIGKLRVGKFALGSVTGTLLSGVLLGQLRISLSPDVQQTFFLLFLFSVGYKSGPQFFRELNRETLRQVTVAFVVWGVGLGVCLVLIHLLGYDAGTAAGLFAGALTESATVGVASGAIGGLELGDAEKAKLVAGLTSSFAVSYLIGTIGAIVFLSQIAPRLLRRNLQDDCREMERRLGAQGETGGPHVRRTVEARAFFLPDQLAGKTIEEAEQALTDQRVFIERILRKPRTLEVTPDLRLEGGDVIVLSGRREAIVAISSDLGGEVDDEALLAIPAEAVDVVVTNKSVIGRTIEEMARGPGARGVFLVKLTRGGQTISSYPRLAVERGDVFSIIGSRRHVEAAAKVLGYADRPTNATDMVFVGLGILLGGLFGLLALRLGKLEIGLGESVGALVGGLVFGWLRSIRRTFGLVPEAALWIFDSLGLNVFIAVVGISAGPNFIHGLAEAGVMLPFAGLVTVVAAHLAAVLVGSHVLKMNGGVLLGACAGAGTSAGALAAVRDASQSNVPTLGYGVSYAVGNVLLAISGTILVALTA
jgi:putative transport protein